MTGLIGDFDLALYEPGLHTFSLTDKSRDFGYVQLLT